MLVEALIQAIMTMNLLPQTGTKIAIWPIILGVVLLVGGGYLIFRRRK